MSETTTSSVAASIDWLTVTATGPGTRRDLFRLGEELVRLSQSRNNDLRDWRWKGYEGSHAGAATCGRRDDSSIVQLSGEMADEWFDQVYRIADHCTRVDLAVTLQPGEESGNLAERHNREVAVFKQATGKTLTQKLIYDNGYASTLYLGSRESDLYARCYDKGVESGDPALQGFWRYEVEVKGQPAQRTAAWLHSRGDRAGGIVGAVHEHYRRRGAEPAFNCLGPAMPLRTIRPTTDDDSRLAWLSGHVRPTVQRLLSNGHADRVWEALGIPRSLGERWRLKEQLAYDHHRSELEEAFGEDGV